jgi:hypothetical protein
MCCGGFLPISAGLVNDGSVMFFAWETVTKKSVVSCYPQQTNKDPNWMLVGGGDSIPMQQCGSVSKFRCC